MVADAAAMKVVQEDDKPADGEAEGTGEGEMGITGGMDEEVNSTVVSPDGTKPCEDEMCILGAPPWAHKSALVEGVSCAVGALTCSRAQ